MTRLYMISLSQNNLISKILKPNSDTKLIIKYIIDLIIRKYY